MEKIPFLKMYINLADILGLLLLVGRLNKSCQMFFDTGLFSYIFDFALMWTD